jgi:Tol biopolymer transport system component
MKAHVAVASEFLFVLAALTGCGGGSSTEQPPPPPPPSPSIASISPTSTTAGASEVTLTVTGSNFASGDVVAWLDSGSSVNLTTTFGNSTQLTATISKALLVSIATAQISIFRSNPIQHSNSVVFAVNYPVPTVSSIAPTNVQAGAAPLTLTVSGSGFFPVSMVQWNGGSRATTFVGSTKLTAAITIPDLASSGSPKVSVITPTPGGGTSSPISFTITPFTSNPPPAISSLADTSTWAGWPGFPLAINGTGFVASTTSQWNGLNRPTTVLSGSLLKSGIPASDLTSPGAAQVAAFNASPGGGTSNLASFTIKPVPPGAVGVIERSSIADDFTEGDSGSEAVSISGDGRFIAFASDASTLVPNDTNGFTDIFLRDTCLGAPAGCLPSVTRLSVATDGTQANGFSFAPKISANARYVAFTSDADNLVPGDTNQFPDIFVRDTCFGAPAGCIASTVRVSLRTDGTQISLQNGEPAISADGRFVAFGSGMGDYYYGPNFNIYVRDTCAGAPTGCKPSTTLISVLPNGQPGSSDSESPAISSTGRFVAFQSANQMTTDDTDQVGDVFLRDTCVGAPAGCQRSTILVSVGDAGSQSANGVSTAVSISATGRFVTFNTFNSNGKPAAVFVRDTCVGAPVGCKASTASVSVASGGAAGDGDSRGGSLSDDGRFIAFESDATNLVSGDTNNATDIFVRDTCLGAPTGCAPSTVRLSATLDGVQGNGSSLSPVLSGDARFVAFVSSATNLGPGDTNKIDDVFLSRTGFPGP